MDDTLELLQERNKNRDLSVIISVCNEEETIGSLLSNVQKLYPKEIIIIENGSTDKTVGICREHGVRCFSYPHPIGHDVGRAVGAKKATGEILLFLDGDIIFQPEELLPYIEACSGDVDIALNNLNPFYSHSSMIDAVSMAKAFLNRLLLLSRLRYSSLTAIPHAMKRTAAEHIGFSNLAVPPKAQAIAALKGLSIQHVQGVDVFTTNKCRKYNSSSTNHVEEMILGDHLEAIEFVQSVVGKRGYLYDTIRLRKFLNETKKLPD